MDEKELNKLIDNKIDQLKVCITKEIESKKIDDNCTILKLSNVLKTREFSSENVKNIDCKKYIEYNYEEKKLIIKNCKIKEFINIDEINEEKDFIDELIFKKCIFECEVLISEKINNEGRIEKTILKDLMLEFNTCTFNSLVAFQKVEFQKNISFYNSTFKGQTLFRYSTFEGQAYFRSCKFKEKSYFSSVNFQQNAKFHNAIFYKDVYFHQLEYDKDFEKIEKRFGNLRPYRKSKLGKIDFSNATILGKCDLSNSEISEFKCEHLSLTDGTKTGSLILKNTDIKDASRGSYAYLKNYFESKKDDISRDEYYVKEMKKDFKDSLKRCTDLADLSSNIPTHAYMCYFSRYGTSWIRPLVAFILFSFLILAFFNNCDFDLKLFIQVSDPTNIMLNITDNNITQSIETFENNLAQKDSNVAIWYIYKLFSIALIYSFIIGLKSRTRGK